MSRHSFNRSKERVGKALLDRHQTIKHLLYSSRCRLTLPTTVKEVAEKKKTELHTRDSPFNAIQPLTTWLALDGYSRQSSSSFALATAMHRNKRRPKSSRRQDRAHPTPSAFKLDDYCRQESGARPMKKTRPIHTMDTSVLPSRLYLSTEESPENRKSLVVANAIAPPSRGEKDEIVIVLLRFFSPFVGRKIYQ